MVKDMKPKDWEVWERVVRSHQAFILASKDFLSEGIDRATVIRKALQSNNRNTAIYFLQWLSYSELQQVFDVLIFLSSSEHGGIEEVRKAILSIPKEWLLENIELSVEPHLKHGTAEEYRRFLELFLRIDIELTRKLARRALEQQEFDTREVGQEFLEKTDIAKSEE
jgi:hypothetical protein